MSSKQQRFDQFYTKALQNFKAGYYSEARKQYIHVLNTFSIYDVEFIEYIKAMGELGDSQRYLNLFAESKKTYLRGIALLREAAKKSNKVNTYQIQKEQYHFYSNLGLTLCAEAQAIANKIDNYDDFKRLIDESISYYKTCQEIVVKNIIQENFPQELSKEIKWWKKQYVGLIVNVLNPLQTQAFQFKDKNAMKIMVELIERAQTFYNLCKNKTKKRIQANLSKCYYSKALCLRFLSKKQESQKQFKKDFDYCSKNDQKVDLEKTRVELVKFYLENFQFKQARQYAKQPEHLAQINSTENEYFKLMKRVNDFQAKLEKLEELNLDHLEDLLDNLKQMNCNKKALEFNRKARNSSLFSQNQDYRYILEYYAALSYIKLELYNEAAKSIKEARQLTQAQPRKIISCQLQQALILQKTLNDRAKVEKIFKQILSKCQKADDDIRQECQNQCNAYLFRQRRRNREFKFDNKYSQMLFDHMRRKRTKSQVESKLQIQEMELMEQQLSENEDIFQQPQKKILKQMTPFSSYLENCKLLNIQPLQKFKQFLKNSSEINFESLVFFPKQQILALLTSSAVIQSLDLRNFVLTVQILRKIHQSENVSSIKNIKLNMINASNTTKQGEFYQALKELLIKSPFLAYLSLSNAYDVEQVQRVFTSNNSLSFKSLTVLKLKQCNLQDKDLLFFGLGERLPQLKKLSLSSNNLEGSTLDTLASLTQLESFSLSSNPLTNVNITKFFQSLKKTSLNNLKSNIAAQKFSSFIPLLMNCQKIKMKNCSEVCVGILASFIESVIQFETDLAALKEITLFGSILKEESIMSLLWRFESKSPNLNVIDLRNCNILSCGNEEKIFEGIKQFQHIYTSKNEIQRRDRSNPQNQRTFKYNNLKLIEPANLKKTFRNFSVN